MLIKKFIHDKEKPTMPIVDLPLSQLRTYAGGNPRPGDIDTFWDAAVARIHAKFVRQQKVDRPMPARSSSPS